MRSKTSRSEREGFSVAVWLPSAVSWVSRFAIATTE